MSQPQNLPDLLRARLKLGLLNWGKRTLIWSAFLGILSTLAPALRFLLVGWLVFSAISLAALLLGLKLANALKTSTLSTFPTPGREPRDVGGTRPEPLDSQDDTPTHHVHTGRNAVSDEIIEIEAEVLPPDPKS